jgi:hypothetical protein
MPSERSEVMFLTKHLWNIAKVAFVYAILGKCKST